MKTPESNRVLRSTASPSEKHILKFDRPHSIKAPGTYYLLDDASDCSFTLFDSIFPTSYLEQLRNAIESYSTLKQYDSSHQGTKYPQPRLSAWYGPIEYNYSSITMEAQGVSDCSQVLAAYKLIADNILVPNKIPANSDSFLINKYRTGKDSCGEHSDNELLIDQNFPIITLSLGYPRVMLIREN